MPFPARLALASKNPGKIREILEICSTWPVSWLTYPEGSWPEVEETGETYLENALLKARAVAAATGIPAVADDSGIEVDALNGGPGPLSARFAGDGAGEERNLRLLIERLAAVPPAARTARYRCVAAYVSVDGGKLWAEGVCEGLLLLERRGAGGFGYDPIFMPEGLERTMAELAPEKKNAISHRGRAFRALGQALGKQLGRPGRPTVQ